MLKNFKIILLLIILPIFIKSFESVEAYNEPASKKQKLTEEQKLEASQESKAYFLPQTNLEEKYIKLINKLPRGQEINLSNYGFGSLRIAFALKEASDAGITSNILLDNEHSQAKPFRSSCLDILLKNKESDRKLINVKKAPRSIFNNCKDSIMHQKILILGNKGFDDKILVMGSYNFSEEVSSLQLSGKIFENIMVLRGPIYSDMINKQIDGFKSYYNTGIDQEVDLDSRQVGLIRNRMPVMLTSDKYNIRETLLELIRKEDKSIKIVMYTFTSNEISEKLIDAHKRGIDIYIYVDGNQAQKSYMQNNLEKLIEAGIYINLVECTRMHHKFLIFESNQIADGKSILANGSYNLTEAANSQHLEDIIFLIDSYLINQFLEEIKKIEKYIEVSSEIYATLEWSS